MHKWWSALFGVVMALAVVSFLVAPFFGWWLPKNVATFGGDVDRLFYIILAITGFFFILTEALLVYFLYVYAGRPEGQHVFGHRYAEEKVFWTTFFKRAFRPVTAIIHNQHRLEIAWTVVPAGILLYIAFAQVSTWADIKYQSRMLQPGEKVQHVEVSARQFEWRTRYPSSERLKEWDANPDLAKDFGDNPHEDDVHLVNEVHVWKGQKVLIHLKTRDVIHSFYLPNLRLKQDALPGKTIPVWFEATESNTAKKDGKWVDGYEPKSNTWAQYDAKTRTWDRYDQIWELNCAELCGWGHYKMQGRLYVHDTKEDFLEWLGDAETKQNYPKPVR